MRNDIENTVKTNNRNPDITYWLSPEGALRYNRYFNVAIHDIPYQYIAQRQTFNKIVIPSLKLKDIIDNTFPDTTADMDIFGKDWVTATEHEVPCVEFFCELSDWDGNESTMDRRGDGTRENPWKNLQYAVNILKCYCSACTYVVINVSGTCNYTPVCDSTSIGTLCCDNLIINGNDEAVFNVKSNIYCQLYRCKLNFETKVTDYLYCHNLLYCDITAKAHVDINCRGGLIYGTYIRADSFITIHSYYIISCALTGNIVTTCGCLKDSECNLYIDYTTDTISSVITVQLCTNNIINFKYISRGREGTDAVIEVDPVLYIWEGKFETSGIFDNTVNVTSNTGYEYIPLSGVKCREDVNIYIYVGII